MPSFRDHRVRLADADSVASPAIRDCWPSATFVPTNSVKSMHRIRALKPRIVVTFAAALPTKQSVCHVCK